MTNNIQSAAVSDRGLSEKRPQNEDSFLELPRYGLFVVADGVGGAQAGDVASQMATEVLGEAFANSQGGDVEDLMRAAIEKANESIYQMSHDLPQLSTMATTIVALHINGNIATIGHVGDSRIYRVDPRGNLFRETQDHSVVEEEVRAGRMTPEQAAHHPSKNVISRALGAETGVEVDMKTIMFEPNTSFLLCSDGITRHIEDTEIRELLRREIAPAEICAEMKNICYSRGAEDNLTAVIVRAFGAETATGAEDVDDDENTIATARSAIVSNAGIEHQLEDSSEIPIRGLEMPAGVTAENFQTQNLANERQVEIPASASFEENKTVETISPIAETKNYQSSETGRVSDVEKTSANSGIGKLFGGLILGLLLGSLIGALAYRFLFRTDAPIVQETPKITEMQSPNIAYSAFENNRRNVDGDPAKYITANGTAADDAEDFYLLGRAYLLTEKYVEAKNSFVKAKELLPQSSGDKAMLGNEIALGLSIVDSSFAKDVLKAERKNISSGSTQSSISTNTNAGANVNTETSPANTQTNSDN